MPPQKGDVIAGYRVSSDARLDGALLRVEAIAERDGAEVELSLAPSGEPIDAHALLRVALELRPLSELGHQGLLPVLDVVLSEQRRPVLVTPRPVGTSLAAHLELARLEVSQGLELLLRVADALRAAHARGLVHRTLSPAAIRIAMSVTTVQVQLGDFGVDRFLPLDLDALRERTGDRPSVASYLSPEQARGRAADRRSDLYALGCIAYELMLGERPFPGKTGIDVLAMQLTDAPPVPSDRWPEIPRELDQLLRALLSKDPTQRPDAAITHAVLRALKTAALPTRGSLRPRPAIDPVARPPMALVALALAAALATLATALVWLWA